MKNTKGGTGRPGATLWSLLAFFALSTGCGGSHDGSSSQTYSKKEEPQVSEAYKAAMEGQPEKKDSAEKGESESSATAFLTTEEVTKDSELREIMGKMIVGHFSGESAYGQLKGRRQALLPDLYRGLQHENTNVRSRIAETLGFFPETKETTDLLLASLNDDPDGDVRSNVAKVAAEYKSRAFVPSLMRILREDENERARANAAEALHAINDPRAKAPMMAALRDVNAWVRLYAVLTMKKQRVKEAIPRLKAMRGDDSSAVRKAVKRALKALGVR
jgi:HEAT repeat protein